MMQVDDESRRAGVQRALRQFGQLVDNRTFLLTFVRTLEANKYFTMKDRVSFASFLMVALQGKMEYCTEILKTLLYRADRKIPFRKMSSKSFCSRRTGIRS
ncbi:PREDICTED: plexin A3-like [Priapulus caudatus]|uniref:Plexin A3-like n=1 Tax=Priapulus caudatus TaxID=37621 RepID=A0ABM1F6E9_PRICU|nr:PREDICTED: plexin A3-like [Priapulus caudatus]